MTLTAATTHTSPSPGHLLGRLLLLEKIKNRLRRHSTNAFHALKLAHRGYVMVNGVITMSGSGSDLIARPEIRQAYLEGGRH